MSKSELKRLCVQNPLGMAEKMAQIEVELSHVKERLAAYEAEPVVGQLCTGCGTSWDDERLAKEKERNPRIKSCCPERKMKDVIYRPTSTAHLEARDKQVWNEAIEEAARIGERLRNGFDNRTMQAEGWAVQEYVEAVRAAKKG